MNRSLHDRVKQASFKLFLLGDRLGVHILPKHYYTPVPDIHWLKQNQEAWIGPAGFDHVDWDLDRQLAWLEETCAGHYDEVRGWGVYDTVTEQAAGPGYGPIESQVLHCVVRRHRPSRVVEIGSGMSTLCMLHAGELNKRDGERPPEITCIEPFPRAALSARTDILLIGDQVQRVDTAVFRKLQAGDLLFVDSSHSVKVGSELARIYLDIIPNLAPGVLVHIHDINFPYLYPGDALRTYFGWQESTLLLALLTDNPRLRVLASLSALHYDRTDGLRSLLTDYVPQVNDHGLQVANDGLEKHFPSSIYLMTEVAPEGSPHQD